MRHLCAFGCLSATLLFAPGAARAQDTHVSAPAPAITDLENSGDIVVTAQKREQRLQDVGLTVAAIDGDTLARKRVSSLADIATMVPGLTFTQSHSGTPVYTLRGVGFYESSLAAYPNVSTYVDQVPLSLPVSALLVGFDLERVEVLKGPQGTLFGNNATGGAINFIAAKPRNVFGAGIDLSYGRFNTVDVAGYVTGPLSDSLNGRFAFKATKGDEWQKSYTRADRTGKTDNVAGRVLLDWTASDRLTLSLNVNGWRNRSDPLSPQHYKLTPQNAPGTAGPAGSVPFDLPVFTYPTAPHNARATDFDIENPPRANDSMWQTALRGDYDLGSDITLTSLSSYLQTTVDDAIQYDGMALEVFDIIGRTGKIKSFTQEIRIARNGSHRLRWVLGANYEHTSVYDSATSLSGDSTSALINGFSVAAYNSQQKMNNYAAFGNVEYDLSDRFTLKAGIRQTQAKRSTASSNYEDLRYNDPGAFGVTNFFNAVWGSLSSIYPNYVPIQPGDAFNIDNRLNSGGTPLDPATYGTAGVYRGKLNEKSTSWSAGIDYKPSRDFLLYANVSQGYKAGSFPLSSAATWSQLVGIKQESLLSYEIGFKSQFLDRRVTLNGAAFYYDYKNKQLRAKIVDGIFGLLDALVNVPKSRIKGAELDLSVRPNNALTLNASATVLDGKVKRYQGTIGSAIDPDTGLRIPVQASYAGANLPYAPKWQLSASAQYDLPISSTMIASIAADVSAQAKSSSILAITPADKRDFTLPSRALVGTSLDIKQIDGAYHVMIWGRNLFNKYYVLNSIVSYDNIVRYAGRPAEYGVTIGFKF